MEAAERAAVRDRLAPLVGTGGPRPFRWPDAMQDNVSAGTRIVTAGRYPYGELERYWTETMRSDANVAVLDVLAGMVGPGGPFTLDAATLEAMVTGEYRWKSVRLLWKIRMDQVLGRPIQEEDLMGAMFSG